LVLDAGTKGFQGFGDKTKTTGVIHCADMLLLMLLLVKNVLDGSDRSAFIVFPHIRKEQTVAVVNQSFRGSICRLAFDLG